QFADQWSILRGLFLEAQHRTGIRRRQPGSSSLVAVRAAPGHRPRAVESFDPPHGLALFSARLVGLRSRSEAGPYLAIDHARGPFLLAIQTSRLSPAGLSRSGAVLGVHD